MAGDLLLSPYLEQGGEVTAHNTSTRYYAALYKEVSARGLSYWKDVTTKRLPESLQSRRSEAKERQQGAAP